MKMINHRQFGINLRKYRNIRGFTNAQLAEYTDLSDDHLKAMQYFRRYPRIETLYRICEALNVTPNDLLL
jgi:transcriptional regulator with XRE-family HTH domain